MSKHDKTKRLPFPWQWWLPVVCILGAGLEYYSMTRRGPFHVPLPRTGGDFFAVLPLIALLTVLSALPLFFKPAKRHPALVLAAQITLLVSTSILLRLYVRSFIKQGNDGAVWVACLTLFLRYLLIAGLSGWDGARLFAVRGRETFSTPAEPEGPGAFATAETNAPSAYTLDRVVCGVCGSRYSRNTATACPSCTAPLEDAVPLHQVSSKGWWKLWEAPSTGQRWAAAGLLLINPLFFVAHVLLLRDVSPWLLALAGVDAVLAALLVWKPVGVQWGLARAGLGLLVAWSLYSSDTVPVLLLHQVVLSVSLGVLLLHRLGGWARLVAVPGPVLYGVLVGLSVFSLATAHAHVTLAVLRITGSISPEPVTLAQGRSERYTLRLPPGSWYSSTPGELDKANVDLALFNPERDVQLAVAVQTLPNVTANRPDLDALESALHVAVEEPRPGITWGQSHDLPGAWDEARVASMRFRSEGVTREGLLALYRRGNRLFVLDVSTPVWRDHDTGPLLAELVQAMSYEPPPPTFLPQEFAQRIKQATVGVRTPGKRGSGFIVQNTQGYLILTAQHLLRSADDKREPREAFVLLPGDTSVERLATVRASDPQQDLALLQLPLDGPARPALPLRKALPAQGSRVVASALPWGEPLRPEALQSWPTLQGGSVKNPQGPAPWRHPNKTAKLIVMEPRLTQDGGPVVDLDGAVVGLAVREVTDKTSVLVPAEQLLAFLGRQGVTGVEAAAPASAAEPFPATVREALSAATVSVSAAQGHDPRGGVVVRTPGFERGVVITSARGAKPGDTVEVRFFLPATQTWKTQPGTVRATRSYPKNTLALVEVAAFPELPPGLPLQEFSHLSETDLVALGGLREVEGNPWPLQRPGVVAGIDRTERWEYGPQSLSEFRVDAGKLEHFEPGPVMDQQGALAGFVFQRSDTADVFEVAAAEQLQELIRGPVRAVSARASRDLKGDCSVEFFVDSEQPLSVPRTVSLAVAAPDPSREGDTLAPVFGPPKELGTLAESAGRVSLPLVPCSGSRLVYQLRLTSALGTQSVEGRLPLPTRALERTQASALLPALKSPHPKSRDFMEWKAEASAPAPTTPQEAVTACTTSPSACHFVTTLGAAAPARERPRLLKALQTSCREGKASACLGWAELADLAAPPLPPRKTGPLTPTMPTGPLESSCERGEAEACSRMARFFLQSSEPRDLVTAARLLRQSCRGGVIEDCSGLDGVLSDLRGVPPGPKVLRPEVRTALGLGCDAGLAEACSRLGRRLMVQGAREPQPPTTPAEWTEAAQRLRKGCEAGCAAGCSDLAVALATGHGVERDEALALRSYRQACRLHDALACLLVGALNRESKTPTQDFHRSYEAFREACALGVPQGCLEMKHTRAGLLNAEPR